MSGWFASNRARLIVVACLLLIGVVCVGLWVWPYGVRLRRAEALPALYGQIDDTRYDATLDAPAIWRRIDDRLKPPAPSGATPDVLPRSAVTVPKSRLMRDATWTEISLARTLLTYGEAIAEQRDARSFETFMTAFEARFMAPGKAPYDRVTLDGDGHVVETGMMRPELWFDYTRVALVAWRRHPTATIERFVQRGADALYDTLVTHALGDRMALPSEWDPGLVSSAVSPTPTPAGTKDRRLVVLADVDLYVLNALATIDTRFAPYAERWTKTLEQAIAPTGARLPAYAVSPDGQNFVYVQNDSLSLDTEAALRTLLHLAEIGRNAESSIAFFRDQIMNGGTLSMAYRIADGAPMGRAATPELYALLARLGRASGDLTLTEAALTALKAHIADDSQSVLYGALFRSAANEAITMMLVDNAWALLALR